MKAPRTKVEASGLSSADENESTSFRPGAFISAPATTGKPRRSASHNSAKRPNAS
jgi:hypothetical protein